MIYQHGIKRAVNVKAAGNGWIVEWEDERNMEKEFGYGVPKELAKRGVQIFTDRKAMLKFVESHV